MNGRAKAWDPLVIGVGMVVALAAMAAFLPVLGNGFVEWDDEKNFLGNAHYRGLDIATLQWAWTTFLLGVYQPLSWMLLGGQYAIWKLNPWGYHFSSLVLHGANAVLLYVLSLKLIERGEPGQLRDHPRTGAACAGLATVLFAVHPLRTEAVAWASCQPYLPCTLFCLLAILAYLRAVPMGPSSPLRYGWLVVSLLLFAAALLCKAMALFLPAVLLVLDVYPLRRLGGGAGRWLGAPARRVWLEKLPFIGLGVIFALIAIAAKKHVPVTQVLVDPQGAFSLGQLAQACYAIGFYLRKTLLPTGISAYYPLPGNIDWRSPAFLFSILGTAGLTVALFVLRRRWPGALAAWLCYVVFLAPTLGVVPYSGQIAADRYSYIAVMGLYVLLAAALFRLSATNGRARRVHYALGIGGGILVAILSVLSWNLSLTWRTSESLWTWAADHGARDNAQVQNFLGLALAKAGKSDAAMRHLQESARLDPRYAEPYNNQAVILGQRGMLGEAEAKLRKVVELMPEHREAHNNLGTVLLRQGRLYDAVAEYAKALRIDPENESASANLATALQHPMVDARVARAGGQVARWPRDVHGHQLLANELARLKN